MLSARFVCQILSMSTSTKRIALCQEYPPSTAEYGPKKRDEKSILLMFLNLTLPVNIHLQLKIYLVAPSYFEADHQGHGHSHIQDCHTKAQGTVPRTKQRPRLNTHEAQNGKKSGKELPLFPNLMTLSSS